MKNKHLVLLFLFCVISVIAYQKLKSTNINAKNAARYQVDLGQITNLTVSSPHKSKHAFSIHPSDNGWLASLGTKHIPIAPTRAKEMLDALTSMRLATDTTRVPDSLLRQIIEITIQTSKVDKVLYLGKPIKRKDKYFTPARMEDKDEPVSIDFHWLEGRVGDLYSLDFQQFRNKLVLPQKLPEWKGLAYTFADFAPLYLTNSAGIWQRPGNNPPSATLHEYVVNMHHSIARLKTLEPSDDFDPAVEKEAFFAELQLETDSSPITLWCFRRNYGKSVYFLKSSLNDSEVFTLPDTLANKIFVVPALGVE